MREERLRAGVLAEFHAGVQEPPDPLATPLPEEFPIQEMEQLRLQVVTSKIGKVMAEYQLANENIRRLAEDQQKREEETKKLADEQNHQILALGARMGIGEHIRKYQINLDTGVCKLQQRQPEVPPPVVSLPPQDASKS